MRFTLAASIIALAASVAAVQVTSPTKGAELDLTKPNTIKWTSVNTDPDKFNIYLVKNSYPQTKTLIASDVDKSKGSYTFDSLKGVTTGDDYQINLESDEPQNTGILAQSEQFSVTKAVAGTTATATTTSGTTTSSHTTLTTISGTASASSTGNAASASSTGNAASASSTGNAASASSTGNAASASSTGNAASASSTGNAASSSSTGNAASSSANASSSSTASPTPSTGAAATLPVSAGAGTFLMALFALFL